MLDISFQKGSNRLLDLTRMANRANTHAWYELAQCYWHGNLTVMDKEKALLYFYKAATKNHPGACLKLGKLYLKGNVELKIKVNRKLAKIFFERAKNANTDYFTPEDQRLYFIEQARLYLRAMHIIKETDIRFNE